MSATVTAPGGRPASGPTPERVSVRPVTFLRVLHSEWLKFWTLRSTWWSLGLTVVLMVGFALLFVLALNAVPPDDPQAQQEMEQGMAAGGVLGPSIVTIGYTFAQLVVAVLGALVMTGEYGTGMVRSTFAAVPARLSALWAKLLVLLAVTAVVSALGVVLAYVATAGMLDNLDLPVDLDDADQLRSLAGAVLYLMVVAAFSLGVGTILRHTAASIGVLMAIFFVVPIVFQIIVAASGAEWAIDVNTYLPSVAGERIMALVTPEGLLEPWTGFAVLGGYAAVALAGAAVSIKTRDA
jgi:ABC-2 type transport system permease protein